MSAVALLLGLLVIAHLGSQLVGARAAGYGLASGAEYLVVGVVFGPYVLGVVERSTIASFAPVAAVGTAWLTLILGVGYGFWGNRRVRFRGLVAGIALSALSGGAAAAAVYFLAPYAMPLGEENRRLLAAGVGLVSCETAQHAVQWVVSRHGASGPLAELVGEIADCDDLVPLLGLMVAFSAVRGAILPIGVLPVALEWWTSVLGTLVLGILLGAVTATLLRAEPRASDGWGALLGAALLGIGVAWRLGMSPQTVTFVLGMSLAAFSRHGVELRSMFARTERPVLLPTLVLAGAQVKVDHIAPFVSITALALAVRLVVRLVMAPAFAGLAGAPRDVTAPLALGLLPTGALTIAIGLVYDMRFPGPVGDTVLAVATVFTIFGEIVGPASLRRALLGAGEIAAVPSGALAQSGRGGAPEPLP
ncbi:MAG TPA: potassium transporter Kef [Polyangiaceae bacterium]|nr:potassium transporter Kef [Polyangiaceae bacterium]